MSHPIPIRRVGTILGGALGFIMVAAVVMVASASNAAHVTTTTGDVTTTTVGKQPTTTLTTLPPKCSGTHCVIVTVTTVPGVTVQGAAVAVPAQPVFTG